MTERYLDKIYAARDPEGNRALYDEWAATYEAELLENGYATPARCAEALAPLVGDKTIPLLDFGCGTGLAGLALRLAGFEVIDGVDISSEMIAVAQEKKIYRALSQIEVGTQLTQDYRLISAVGVIGAGAAPVSTLDMLMHALPQGGMLVFSFNDHSLADPCATARLNEWLDCGAARLLFMEHGPHLPSENLQSTVYVLEKD